MYLYLVVLIRTSLGFLWSFISLKDWVHWVSEHWFWAYQEEIAARQDSCHPCSRPASAAWRSKGALLSCGSVCLHLDQGFGLWHWALYSVLGLQAPFPSACIRVSIQSLTFSDWLWRAEFPCTLAPIVGMTFPVLVLSYLSSMHNWSACGFLGWLKSLVGMVEI